MRALIKKELMPLAAPAVVGTLLSLGLWLALFDAHSAFFAAPSDALLPLVGLACALGAALGYQQIAGETGRETLTYLLHREATPGRVLLAKCLAAWLVLALVLDGSLVLAALYERATSPFGAVMRWRRLAELVFASVVAVPAHALGLHAAGLRGGTVGKVLTLVAALIGTVLGLALVAGIPVRPAAGAGLVALAASIPAVGALLAVRARLALSGDPERAPRPVEVAVALAVFAVLIGSGGALALGIAQFQLVQSANAGRPRIVWHAEHGPALAEPVRHGREARFSIRDASGAVLDEVPAVGHLDGILYHEEWHEVWAPDGRLASELELRELRDLRGYPNFAPGWLQVRRSWNLSDHAGGIRARLPDDEPEDPFVPAVLDVRQEPAEGFFHVLTGRLATGDAAWSDVELHTLARGDGRRFGPDAFCFYAGERARTAWLRDYGADLADPGGRRITVFDPSDRTAWALDATWPIRGFEPSDERPAPVRLDETALLVGRYRWAGQGPSIEEGEEALRRRARVRAEAEGDPLASVVRVVDATTGEVLLEHRYGLERFGQRAAAAALYASELLRPPVLALLKHAESPGDFAWQIRPDGFLVTAGRRRALLLADLAVAVALALVARSRLARRGAEPWRRRTWTAAILVLGPLGALALVAVEPGAPRAARLPAGAAPRRTPLVAEALSEASA